jgi:hypothetical protein
MRQGFAAGFRSTRQLARGRLSSVWTYFDAHDNPRIKSAAGHDPGKVILLIDQALRTRRAIVKSPPLPNRQ